MSGNVYYFKKPHTISFSCTAPSLLKGFLEDKIK